MARPFAVPDDHEYGHNPKSGEWHALRGELVALLDHVEGQYTRASAQQPGYDGLAQRMRELRYQVAETQPADRHQEALRSVKRAVERFSERDESQAFPPNPQDVLKSAIHEIRSRQRSDSQVASPAATVTQFERLVQSVTTIAGRLERLEGEIGAQRENGDVKAIGEQLAQLTHVVELLAGAVGETGQVKRLEGQIAGLATLISEGRNADVQALTSRLEDLAGTVERLAQAQANDPTHRMREEQQADFRHGMQAIEDNVRQIYDRIDAIERNVTLAPQDLNRLTEEMAAFTTEMRESASQVKPNQLLARVDALNARLADIESKDELVGDLKADVDALRKTIIETFELRFDAIELQLGSINERLSFSGKADPSFAQIEAQIRQLVERMDETGEQLSGLARLYSQPEAREPVPDFEALASLVAKRTSDAFARSSAPASNGLSDETFAELEKRMSKLFAAASKTPEDLSDVQDGIRRVDERLGRLEAALSLHKLSDQPVAGGALFAPLASAELARDAMPKSPAIEAPLIDRGFAADAKAPGKPPAGDAITGAAKMREVFLPDAESGAQLAGMRPVTPEMVGGKSQKHAAEMAPPARSGAQAEQPVFNPTAVARPPRPASSLDLEASEQRAFAPPVAPVRSPMPDIAKPTEAIQPASASSRNTFIEAARRAAQRQSPAQNQPSSNSLIGRAMSRFQANSEGAAPGPDLVSAPLVESPKPTKTPKAKKAEIVEGTEKQSFLRRHRQPLLLAATLLAVGLLTLNLINQRMAASAPESAVAESAAPTPAPVEPTPVEPAATTPAGDLSQVDEAKPAASVRAIPGTGAEAIDTLAVGSINPMAAMNFTKPAEVAAMPPALQFAQDKPAQDLPVIAEGPVKLELPPEAVGPLALRQAAADGDARAQFEIAAIYSEDRTVKQDYAQALIWYERAAAQGFAPAQYRLGNLYEGGKGTEKNLEQARLWYQRAAEAGNRMSMHNLAALYAGGSLGKQEFASAAEWFEQAAMRGMTDSQFNLGMLYARGLGVTQDMEASFKWFSLAARSGDADAAKGRDDIAKSLDTATVTRLSADIGAWKAVPIDLPANFAPIGAWAKDFDAGEPITNKTVVTKVQAALVRLGYDVGSPDGVAGPKTAEAIKSFEKATGMNETGAINPRLLAVLGSQPV
jgi:localization factor PodJL